MRRRASPLLVIRETRASASLSGFVHVLPTSMLKQLSVALAEPEGEQRVEPHGEQPCPCSAAARRDGDRCFLEIERAHGLLQDAKPALLEVG